MFIANKMMATGNVNSSLSMATSSLILADFVYLFESGLSAHLAQNFLLALAFVVTIFKESNRLRYAYFVYNSTCLKLPTAMICKIVQVHGNTIPGDSQSLALVELQEDCDGSKKYQGPAA